MPESWPAIDKDLSVLPRRPNLVDYDEARASFSWTSLRAQLDGLPGGGLNIAHEAVDRHAARDPDRLALRWLGRHAVGQDPATADIPVRDLSYGELQQQTSRFASGLAALARIPHQSD